MALATTQLQLGFGSGVMFATRTDINDGTPYSVAALQDVTVSFNGELRDLFSQGQFPIAVARGKTKIECKAKMALISTPLYNTLFFGSTIATGQTLVSYAESHTVPTAGTVTVDHPTNFSGDLGVYDGTTGQQLTFVAGTLSANEYDVNDTTGVYTFNATQTGHTVLISYEYTATTGFTLSPGNPLMGTTPVFQTTFYESFLNNSMTLTLFNCVGTTLSIPTGGVDNFYISDFAFSAFADAAGRTFQLSTNQ